MYLPLPHTKISPVSCLSNPMKLQNPNFPALLCSTFLHIILLFTVTSSATPTNETDRLALLKFKESIDYDPYGILSSWNDSFHICNWHGITCAQRHQRVTTLELPGHNLRGTINSPLHWQPHLS